MALRGLSVITYKAAASLPNRQTEGLRGAKVRLSSGESRFRTESSLNGYFFGVCVVCLWLASAIAEGAD